MVFGRSCSERDEDEDADDEEGWEEAVRAALGARSYRLPLGFASAARSSKNARSSLSTTSWRPRGAGAGAGGVVRVGGCAVGLGVGFDEALSAEGTDCQSQPMVSAEAIGILEEQGWR